MVKDTGEWQKNASNHNLVIAALDSTVGLSGVESEYFQKSLRKSINKLEIACLKGDARFLRGFAKHGKEIARQ